MLRDYYAKVFMTSLIDGESKEGNESNVQKRGIQKCEFVAKFYIAQ